MQENLCVVFLCEGLITMLHKCLSNENTQTFFVVQIEFTKERLRWEIICWGPDTDLTILLKLKKKEYYWLHLEIIAIQMLACKRRVVEHLSIKIFIWGVLINEKKSYCSYLCLQTNFSIIEYKSSTIFDNRGL